MILRWAVSSVFVFAIGSGAFAAKVTVSDPAYDEYEGLALVDALARDGQREEALIALASLRPAVRSTPHALLLGLELRFETADKTSTLDSLRSIVTDTGLSFELRLRARRLQARVAAEINNWKLCIEALEDIKAGWRREDRLSAVRCARESGQFTHAWEWLREGSGDAEFALERVETMLQIGVIQQGTEYALRTLASGSLSETQGLRTAELFSKRGLSNETLRILEALKLRYPLDMDVRLSWAQAAFRVGLARDAAEGFAVASVREPKFAYTAAELFRVQGRPSRAQFLQFFIRDENERIRHQLAIALDQGRYELIAALSPVVSRSSLRTDDEVAYTLGYALMKEGQFQAASRWLKGIRHASFAPKAIALLKIGEACRASLSCRF